MAQPNTGTLSADYPALLAWFNHLPCFERTDDFTNEDLSDGTRIWQALHDFAPLHFQGELPEGPGSSRRRASHVGNLQNIKRIFKALRQYLVEDCSASTPPGFDDSDLNLIAEGGSRADLALLLKALLSVAVLHPSEEGNEPFLLAISQLPGEHQGTLAKVIGELQDAEDAAHNAPAISKSPRPSSSGNGSSDLRSEEQMYRTITENKDLEREKYVLKRELEDRENRLLRLQQNNTTLQEQLEQAQASLETATESDNQAYHVRELEAKNKGQDDYIADLEEKMQSAQDKETALQTEINKLRKASEKLQPLQDEVDELKAAKDSLSRRNNVLERYKNKLQSVQEIENENRALRREIEEMRYTAQEGDGATLNNTALQREVMELKILMSNTEIQLVEATNRRKQIEYDNEELLRRLDEAAAQRERDQEAMSRMREGSPPLDNNVDGQFMDLDAELESTGKKEMEKNQELQSRQERLRRAGNEEAARRLALQDMYDKEKKANVGLQKRNLELTRKNVGLEGILKEPDSDEQYEGPEHIMREANSVPSQKAYTEMQEKVNSIVNENESLRKERDAFQVQVNDAEKTIATYDQEKVEALETLKELNSKECVELRAKIIAHEESNVDLRLELDEHRAMLIDALKQAPNPPPQVVVEPPTDTMTSNETDTEDAELAQRMHELMIEVQTAKDREKSQQEELEKRDRAIEELHSELRSNAEKAAPALLKASEQAALKQENENLRRETKLMATAYFDLGSRLQMNNVSLQRRQDAPKSFLNRQRLLVTQAATVRR